jgi:hypothetical protein
MIICPENNKTAQIHASVWTRVCSSGYGYGAGRGACFVVPSLGDTGPFADLSEPGETGAELGLLMHTLGDAMRQSGPA